MPDQRSTVPLAGTVLILIGCVQLAYSTLAIVSAFGGVAIEVLVMFVRGFFSMGPDGTTREITGTESGPAFIDAALSIGSLGFGLAVFALAAGILMLRNRQCAFVLVAVVVIHSVLLAYRHLLISWYTCTAIYAAVGSLYTVLLIVMWKLNGSPSFNAPSTKEMVD